MSVEIDYLMDFKEFCDYVSSHVKNYLGVEYQDYEIYVSYNLPTASGKEYTALMIKAPDSRMAPAIHLDDYFSDYQQGEPVGSVMNRITDYRMGYDKHIHPVLHNVVENHYLGIADDWSKAKDRIIFSVVGNSLRGNSLDSRPSKSLGGDLVAIYNIDLGLASDGALVRMPVTNSLLQFWNVTTEELHDYAVKNTSRNYPVKISNMDDIFQGFGSMSFDASYGSTFKPRVTVITNDRMTNGAAALFYPGVLERVNEMYPYGYAVLPSSIHEVIIAPGNPWFDLDGFSKMVQEINASIVPENEQLSNYAHVYDPKTHGLIAPGMERAKIIGESSLRRELPSEARALADSYDKERLTIPADDVRRTDNSSATEHMTYEDNYNRRSGR